MSHSRCLVNICWVNKQAIIPFGHAWYIFEGVIMSKTNNGDHKRENQNISDLELGIQEKSLELYRKWEYQVKPRDRQTLGGPLGPLPVDSHVFVSLSLDRTYSFSLTKWTGQRWEGYEITLYKRAVHVFLEALFFSFSIWGNKLVWILEPQEMNTSNNHRSCEAVFPQSSLQIRTHSRLPSWLLLGRP